MKKIEKILDILGTKKAIIISLAFAIILPSSFVIAEFPSNEQPYPAKFYAMCFDKKDNDGDGKIDLQDSDCPKCNDGKDNDGDGLIDEKDPDCPKEAPKTSFWGAAAAVLGVQTNDGGETTTSPLEPKPFKTASFAEAQSFENMRDFGNGNSPLNCNGRISIFQKRVKDYNGGWHYEYSFYCLPYDFTISDYSNNSRNNNYFNYSSIASSGYTLIGSYPATNSYANSNSFGNQQNFGNTNSYTNIKSYPQSSPYGSSQTVPFGNSTLYQPTSKYPSSVNF